MNRQGAAPDCFHVTLTVARPDCGTHAGTAGTNPHPAGSSGTGRPVPPRRPGVPDRAGRPRPARRPAPLGRRRPPAGRLYQHRARPALGGAKPRQAHRHPESRLTTMTKGPGSIPAVSQLPAGASRTARPGRPGKNWRISQLALPTCEGQPRRQAHGPAGPQRQDQGR
jgi:hypothetical protein